MRSPTAAPDHTGRKVARMLRPNSWWIALLLAVTAVSSALITVPAIAYQRIIDLGVVQGDLGSIALYSTVALGAVVAAAATQWGSQLLAASLTNRLGHDLRTRTFRHAQRLDVDFHVERPTGDLLSRMSNDVQAAQGIVSNLVVSILGNVIKLAFVVGTMTYLSWELVGLALIGPALAVPVTRHTARVIKQVGERRQRSLASVHNFLVDRLGVDGVVVAALHRGWDRDADQFGVLSDRVRRDTVRTAGISGAFQNGLTCVTALSVTSVYLVGGLLVVRQDMSLGMLVGFVALLPSVHGPLTNIVNARVEVVGAMIGFRRVFEILETRPAVVDPVHAGSVGNAPRMLAFHEVGYVHRRPSREGDDLAWCLRDVSFTLARGEVVALLGPSGAGKSTIAQLSARLRDPVTGHVRLDGHELDEIRLSEISRHVGLLSQDSYMFHDTIAANLRYARPDATDDEMVGALRSAGLWEPLVARLPQTLDTVVGDRGSRLSGGERQRLAIARLLLRRPSFVVLDEATAGLDEPTARTVLDTVLDVFRDSGILMITHDTGLVAVADRVIAVTDGRIVTSGDGDTSRAESSLAGAGRAS